MRKVTPGHSGTHASVVEKDRRKSGGFPGTSTMNYALTALYKRKISDAERVHKVLAHPECTGYVLLPRDLTTSESKRTENIAELLRRTNLFGIFDGILPYINPLIIEK